MFRSGLIFILYLGITSCQQISNYIAYRSNFDVVTSCSSNQYFDIALLQCQNCPTNSIRSSLDPTNCDCANNTLYYAVNQGGGSLSCLSCRSGYIRSSDGFGCVSTTVTCPSSNGLSVLAESDLTGLLPSGSNSDAQPRVDSRTCEDCTSGTRGEQRDQRCTPCATITPRLADPQGATIECCTSTEIRSGLCLRYVLNGTTTIPSPSNFNRYAIPSVSRFIQENLETSLYLCRMNVNLATAQAQNRTLSNVTACHIVANIAAMQFYFPEEGYAYRLYETQIWEPASRIWSSTSPRPSIPFLAYPSTYYNEISSSSYNWIPGQFQSRNLVQIKFAKYSYDGKYQGLFDGHDSVIHLCGRGYTDGRAAFTFGTVFNRTCFVRIDAIWSSDLYETAFFEPYIVFQQNGVEQMLPIPVVIRNYRRSDGSQPNRNDEESNWVYHRRFFLIDRISGISTSGTLNNVHYAKTIRISHRLVSGVSYIQPPVVIIEYEELSLSQIGRNGLVRLDFESRYQMDLSSHIRDIWIAIGVLCGSGLLLAFLQTFCWFFRSGKQTIDLLAIGKLILNWCNVVATVFFIVMAGVSLWWLIFFKRDDSVFLVLPTASQQSTFTALVVVAFILKTLDVLQMIIRQSTVDIFFVDWEKSQTIDKNEVSIWRSYFVANELNEIQVYRRLSITFQLISVLFWLKVINLENVATAQPNTVIFPTTADYQAQYNGILRVGIAFSMWLGMGLIQYLFYTFFFQFFVENVMINFIDMCSMTNISVLMLLENRYGYYIHGRSPHEMADIDMRQMLMQFQQESKQMIGKRGLETGSDDQSFIIKVSRPFRSAYDNLLFNYQNRVENRASKKDDDHESEILLASYRNLNDFLCSFLSRLLPTHNYVVRRRYPLEKILNIEFQKTQIAGSSDSIFYKDPDRNFTRCFFFGHENSLFIWNMATFLFVDYFAFNYVLAACITFLFNALMTKLRLNLGRNNLSKKTLIPKCFLI